MTPTAVGAVIYPAITVLFVLTSVLLLVPVLRRRRSLIYRRGVLFYSLSVGAYAVDWVLLAAMASPAVTNTTLVAAYYLLYTVAGLLHLAAVWRFARDFLTFTDETNTPPSVTDETGGFERAD